MGRIVALVVALFALNSAPALASGTLSINVSGVGSVTDAGGLNCVRASVGAPASGCARTYIDRLLCNGTSCFTIKATASITAAAGSGFVFSGWSGGCSGTTNPCGLTMDDDRSVNAVFTDVAAPTVTLLAPANGAKLHGDVRLTASAADNSGVVDHVVFKLDDRSVTDTAAPFEAVISSARLDGTIKATATAFDGAGKSVSDTATVLIDNVDPSLKVAGPNGETFGVGSRQTWSLDAFDASSGVASVFCSVVPAGAPAVFGACSSGASGHSVVNKPGGSYIFTARVTDGAGNTFDIARPFFIDGTPPVTSLSGGVDDGATTTDTAFTWSFTASEAAAFACRVYPAALTPGDFAPCSADASHTASGFAPGVYAFEVRATDAFGNVETAPVKRTFTIAAPAPAPAAAGASNLLAASSSAKVAPQILFTVAFSFANSTKKQTKLTSLVVKNVPAGSTVSATCPKSCAKKTFKKTGASGNVSLAALIKKPLKVGTKITITVSNPGYTSMTKTLKVQPRKSPTVTTRSI